MNMTIDYKEIALRALVTAVEAFLAVIIAAGTTELNVETAEAAIAAAIAAAVSVIYNAVRAWLDARRPVPVDTTATALRPVVGAASVPRSGDLDIRDHPL